MSDGHRNADSAEAAPTQIDGAVRVENCSVAWTELVETVQMIEDAGDSGASAAEEASASGGRSGIQRCRLSTALCVLWLEGMPRGDTSLWCRGVSVRQKKNDSTGNWGGQH